MSSGERVARMQWCLLLFRPEGYLGKLSEVHEPWFKEITERNLRLWPLVSVLRLGWGTVSSTRSSILYPEGPKYYVWLLYYKT